MFKNPISFRFIIGSPLCSIKPLSKDITSVFKFFMKNLKDIIQEEKNGLESRPSGQFGIAPQ